MQFSANKKVDPIKPPSPILIELANVSMAYDNRPVLENVSLDICRGDFLAITGPNGGGKSTLLRIILKLLKPTSGKVIYFSGGRAVKRLPIGYLPQKNMIDSRFPITVNQVVSSGLINSGLSSDDARDTVLLTLERIGMTSHRNSPIGELSGGQLQRTLLGRAIVSNPSLLVLDEPLSYIDKRFEPQIYDIISEFMPRATVILVSHEMSRIAAMANRHLIVNRTITHCTASHHYFHN